MLIHSFAKLRDTLLPQLRLGCYVFSKTQNTYLTLISKCHSHKNFSTPNSIYPNLHLGLKQESIKKILPHIIHSNTKIYNHSHNGKQAQNFIMFLLMKQWENLAINGNFDQSAGLFAELKSLPDHQPSGCCLWCFILSAQGQRNHHSLFIRQSTLIKLPHTFK